MACFVIGFVNMLIAYSRIDSMTSGVFTLVMMLGALIVFAGFVFAAVAICCPQCGSHWFWEAVSGQRHDRWLVKVLQPECAVCRHNTELRKRS